MSSINSPGLKGAYAGERLFLIGNGPSLAETPLDALEDDYTMAMNRIDLIYDTVAWRPDFYICMRNEPIIQGPYRNSLDVHVHMNDVQVFVNELQRNLVQCDKKINFLTQNDILLTQISTNLSVAEIQDVDIDWLERFWSYDPREIVYGFHTMYIGVQLAMWMGFREIYILGADLGLGNHMVINNKLDPAFYGGDAVSYFTRAWQAGKLPSAIVNGFAFKASYFVRQSDFLSQFTAYSSDHFDDSYSNVIHSAKLNEQLRMAHLIIKRICESNALDVYNATLGGELEVYPRVNLASVL